jgi:hypothetical protein
MTELLLVLAVLGQTHPCDTPSAGTQTAPANQVVQIGWCQPDKDIVEGFTLTWNGGLLELGIGPTATASIAAKVGPVSAKGMQEWRTPLFFSPGTHTLSMQAWNTWEGKRQPSGPSTVLTVEAKLEAPLPVDCEVSPWSGWTNWSEWKAINATTEARSRTRTRVVTKEPANGGKPCPALTETEVETRPITVDPCVAKPFVVDRIAWPSANTGRRTLTFRTVEPWASFNFLWPNTLTVKATRGCETTVKR